MKLMGPYKHGDAKSYQVKGVSRLDHRMVTAERRGGLRRSAMGLAALRNPQLPPVTVTQITIIL